MRGWLPRPLTRCLDAGRSMGKAVFPSLHNRNEGNNRVPLTSPPRFEGRRTRPFRGNFYLQVGEVWQAGEVAFEGSDVGLLAGLAAAFDHEYPRDHAFGFFCRKALSNQPFKCLL